MKKFILFVIVVFTACDFPKDPENSYEKAKQTALKIGLIENPPYVTTSGENPGGREVEMLQEFASREGLKVEYSKGSESQLIEKLHQYKLHIIAGGMDKKTVWKKKAGLTTTYDGRHVFLIPKGENKLLERLERFIFSKKKTK